MAFHAEACGNSGGSNAVLTRAGFGDDAFFAHAAGKQCLTDGIVYLVCAGVVQVFAFQPDLRAAQMLGQSCGMVNGAGSADVVFQIAVELFPKRRVVFRGLVGRCQFLQGGNKGFGNVHAAVFTEKSTFIRCLVIHKTPSSNILSNRSAII